MESPINSEALRKIRLLTDLDASDLSIIFEQTERLWLSNAQTLNASEWAGRVAFVWSGQYRILVEGPKGGALSVRVVQDGGHFGEIPAFAAVSDLSYTLCVDRGGLLLTLPRQTFKDLVRATPALCEAVMTAMAQAAVLRADRLYEFAFLDIRTRLLAELLRLSYRLPLVDGAIRNAPTHEALASSVGSSREIVTRILGDLREEGLVDARYRIIRYLDYARLQQIVRDAVGSRPSFTFSSHETTH